MTIEITVKAQTIERLKLALGNDWQMRLGRIIDALDSTLVPTPTNPPSDGQAW